MECDISHDLSSFLSEYCFLYEAPFSTSRSILFFANDETTNHSAYENRQGLFSYALLFGCFICL